MKTLLIVAAFALLPFSAQALIDGEYTCGSDTQVNTILVKSLEIQGVSLPYLEITKVVKNEAGEVLNTYLIKGIPTYSSNDKYGKEHLNIGALSIELKNGKPACVKDL